MTSRANKKSFSELSTPAQASIVIGGVLQVVYAIAAFADLARRPAAEVRGPKALWIPVILVNWIGPAAYFLGAIKRSQPELPDDALLNRSM